MSDDPRWVHSSRLASPEALAPFTEVVGAMDAAAQALLAQYQPLSAVAAAEAHVRAVLERTSARRTVAADISGLLNDTIGGLLSDSAHVLFHSNLQRLVDEYGIAPLLNDRETRDGTSVDPVTTQYPMPYTASWFKTTADRLGSSTLLGLEQPPLASGFAGWQEEVIAAFHDAGDGQRPVYPVTDRLAALCVTVQGSDPEELRDKFQLLIRMFSTSPSDMVMPRVAQFVRDMRGSRSARGAGIYTTPLLPTLRPHLEPDVWSTSPDFVRLPAADAFPLLGGPLRTLLVSVGPYRDKPPTSAALEGFAESLQAGAEHLAGSLKSVTTLLSTLEAMLAQPGFSRLWIPPDAGGPDRIVQEIQEAEGTRKDPQRVVSAGLIEPNPYARYDILPYSDAVARQALDPSFIFTPAENLLVAGVVVVLKEGPLTALFHELFSPKDADEAEDSGGPPVPIASSSFTSPSGAVEATSPPGAPGSASSPGTVPVGADGGPRRDVDREASAWTQAPLRQAAPLGTARRTGGNVQPVRRVPRLGLFPVEDGEVLQLVREGEARPAPLRHEDGVARLLLLGGETLPARLVAGSMPLSAADLPVEEGGGGRAPVGPPPLSAGGDPSAALPMDAHKTRWADPPVGYFGVNMEVADGGATFTSAEMRGAAVSAGYTGGSASMADLAGGDPWWADVRVEWVVRSPLGDRTRAAFVRTQVVEVRGTAASPVFVCRPALPSAPVVASNALTGVAWAGKAPGVPRRLVPRSDAGTYDDYAEGEAPGAAFASVVGWRRSSAEPESGLFPTLQAEVLGFVVDSDTSSLGKRAGAVLDQTSTRGIPSLKYLSLARPELPRGAHVHSVQPGRALPLVTQADVVQAGALEASPADVYREAYERAAAPVTFPYYTWTDAGTSGPSAEDYRSARPPRGTGDTSLLSVFAPRRARVGLGVVSAGAREVPGAAGAEHVRSLVMTAGHVWEDVSELIDGAGGGAISAKSALLDGYAGLPWVLELEWDTSTGEVGASLLTSAVPSADAGRWFDEADSALLLPGDPICARWGAGYALEAAFSSAGRADGEGAWAGLPDLVGRSRAPVERQGAAISITLSPAVAWEGVPHTWTLWRTASHLLAWRDGRLELFEEDILTGDLVLRATLRVPVPAEGVRFRARVEVSPQSRTVSLSWAEETGGGTPGYTDVAAAAETVLAEDPYPFVRALDGFPLDGATVRLGRPAELVQLSPRTATPYYDNVDVVVGNSVEPRAWAIGCLPQFVVSIEAEILPPSP